MCPPPPPHAYSRVSRGTAAILVAYRRGGTAKPQIAFGLPYVKLHHPSSLLICQISSWPPLIRVARTRVLVALIIRLFHTLSYVLRHSAEDRNWTTRRKWLCAKRLTNPRPTGWLQSASKYPTHCKVGCKVPPSIRLPLNFTAKCLQVSDQLSGWLQNDSQYPSKSQVDSKMPPSIRHSHIDCEVPPSIRPTLKICCEVHCAHIQLDATTASDTRGFSLNLGSFVP